MSIVDELKEDGLVEEVEIDTVTVLQWLDDASRHLKAAGLVVEVDPSGAYVLAYDAARKSVAAALLTTGHRVLSRPGAHIALARYARSLAEDIAEPALLSLDRMRRNRNRSEYGSRTFSVSEALEGMSAAGAIRDACAKFAR